MIINDLDGYYIVFDTKNWNTELDTLVIGRITKLEMEKFIKAQYFEIKEVLDKNSKKGR